MSRVLDSSRRQGSSAWFGGVALAIAIAVPGPVTSAGPAAERRATIFYTGGVRGTLEPCGCTSDPLGDVARMTGLVRRAQSEGKAVLLVDAGNLSYPAGEILPRR